MKVTMTIAGMSEIQKKLQTLTDQVAEEHIRKAALKGAEVIRKEAALLAPRKTGTLAKSIKKEISAETKGYVEIKVGPGSKGWYGHLVEDGHPIVRNKKVVGYAAPHPFLRPAADAKMDEAQQVFAEDLKRRLGL